MTNTQQLVGFGPANVNVLDITGMTLARISRAIGLTFMSDILQDLCMTIHRSEQHFSVAFPKGEKKVIFTP